MTQNQGWAAAGSFLAQLSRLKHTLSHIKTTTRSKRFSIMGKRGRTHSLGKPYLLSLPEDIDDRLNDRNLCSVKRVCKTPYSAPTKLSGTELCGRLLTLTEGRLKALNRSPEASRRLQKRMYRYSRVLCDFSDESMRERRVKKSQRTAGGVVQPLLPSLLACCVPSAELTLIAKGTQGQQFLSTLMPQGSSMYAGPQLSTFLAGLKQHLTDLTLAPFGNQGRARYLEALSTLTALRKLKLCTKAGCTEDSTGRIPYCTLSGKKLVWKLPHLDYLALCCLEAGTIVLSCPKLAEVSLTRTKSLQVKIEDAALGTLLLSDSLSLQFVLESPETQLQSLNTLWVEDCIEEGRHLIQDVSHMINLQKLKYISFSAFPEDGVEIMPSSFPQSLQEIYMYTYDWCLDVPRGLKELHQLRSFIFHSLQKPWTFTVPLAWLLPVDSPKLEVVHVGWETYYRRDEAKWMELQECLGTMRDMRREDFDFLFR